MTYPSPTATSDPNRVDSDDCAEIIFSSSFPVELVDLAGSDKRICQAARVSTLGADSIGSDESAGLIKFLLSNRHGSPFEHGLLTFRISAPIFVWREFMRHRIGFSYNEQSGRYMELEPKFYLPSQDRPLRQVGKAGAYSFVKGSEEMYHETLSDLGVAYCEAWKSYSNMLRNGVAKELARACLPVATYSTAYVTCNPRSLMSFLSLRTKDVESKFPSYPQYEIEQVARDMEAIFAEAFPLTYAAFQNAGRVSP